MDKQIGRPIDPACIEKLFKLSKDSGSSITKIKVSTTDKFLDKVPVETFIGYVSYWNTISDLMTSIQGLVTDSSKGYKDDTLSLLKNTQEDLRTSGFKLRSIRKIILQEDPSMGSMVPDIRSFK